MNQLLAVMVLAVAAGQVESEPNWYQSSFFLLHEDHHTLDRYEVGRDADLEQTRRLLALCRPDVIQIHAKGNPGWTTYPSKIGYTPPKLVRDVLDIWRTAARSDGYHFSVYYNIGRDGEIMKRHPQWNRSKADGSQWDRALCYHSGVAEEYLWPMVREIMAGYQPDGFWFDGSCFTVRVCYCQACRARFQREQGRQLPSGPDQPGWDASKEMQREIYRQFVHQTVAVVHRIDPKCLVAVNWAYSLRMPERPDPGIGYLTGDIGNRVEGLSPEAHWYDGQGLPFDLMTQLNTIYAEGASGSGKSPLRFAPKPPVQLQQEMAIVIANGGRFFVWDDPTPESGLVPERFEYMQRVVAPFLRKRQKWCLGYQRVADVSLLHSAAAHYAVTESASTCFPRRDNRIDGACRNLSRLHLNYEMLGDWRLVEHDVRTGVLIVEHPKKLSQSTATALLTFVRNGGTLLLTGMGIGADPSFRSLLGIADWTAPKGSEPLVAHLDGGSVAFRHWLFRARPAKAETLIEVSDRSGDRFPLLTSVDYGRGKALYAAVPLLSEHGKDVVPHQVLREVFEQVVPVGSRMLVTDAPDTVEVVLRRKKNRLVVHLVNMAPGERLVQKVGTHRYVRITHLPPVPPCSVSVRLPGKPVEVRLQPQDQPVPDWRYEAGRLKVGVPGFVVHQMLAIELAQ